MVQNETQKEAVVRDTVRDLFKNVLEMVKANGHYEAAEAILDYEFSNYKDNRELTNYEFDSIGEVKWGRSGGIYVEWSLNGRFDGTYDRMLHVGTFRTLLTSVEAFKTMGELAGALTYYCHVYVNANLSRYDRE